MLAFLDLETTGLDPRAPGANVLEVACILTLDDLTEVAQFHSLVNPSNGLPLGDGPAWLRARSRCDTIVQEMHDASGLWEDVSKIPDGMLLRNAVDGMLAAFLTAWTEKLGAKPPQLAGNTINFDRAWLEVFFPKTTARLHYRNLDCSTLNETFRRVAPAIHEARPRAAGTKHRALDDARESVELARYYFGVIRHGEDCKRQVFESTVML